MDDIDDALSKRATQERLLISKLSREDLEDKYLKVYDENILLKKHARKQEDRIKKMATKLIRLVNDKKKSLNANSSGTNLAANTSGKRVRDVETEELVAELNSKVSDLEMQNKRLKENLQKCKVQLQTLQAQKNPVSTVYSNVTARIDTGLPRRAQQHDVSFTKNVRTVSQGNLSSRSVHTPSNRNNINNNQQIQELEYENADLKSRIDDFENQIGELHEQLSQQRVNYEDELSRLKNQVSQEHIMGVQENIDQIRLHRELKDKSNQYTELYAKFSNLSQQHVQLKDNHDHLLNEIERYNHQLKQEQQRCMSLKTELKNAAQGNREILELKERVEDLNRENEILKEANQKLLNSAFSLEREREFRERERTLKIQIAQLEATLKADLGEKGTILDKLNNEREQYEKLNSDLRETQVKYYEMKQKYDDMSEKMHFLSKESNIDFSEIEEALILVRERRTRRSNEDEFTGKLDAERAKAYQRKIVDLEAQLAETIGELEKSRHLLITQVKINDDYKKEVNLIQSKMEDNKAEYDGKMLEYAQLLDLRAARIKKLERQLKDIAYGTRAVRIDMAPNEEQAHGAVGKRRDSYSFVGAPTGDLLDHRLIANLERGQNIFEIHLTRIVFSEEAIHVMHEQDPSTFCTIEFYEHELQTTPIVKGQRPEYNFTSQYVIKVDDFFLHYMQKETTTVELHHAIGSDYETKAACQLSFRELIDKQTQRIHGSARLICVNSSNVGVVFGTLEYWARLIVPVDEAFRLYKERTKALGYLASNNRAVKEAERSQQKTKSDNNMNELNVNILRCTRLKGSNDKVQPSPYCVYTFFDFADHDTEIISSSNNPEFNDHKFFAVQMDIDLDKYLKSEFLSVYVFDDNESVDNGQYLGVAKIPLIGLAHDKDVKGTFELKKVDGSQNGTIDVTLYWKYSYLPPAASTFAVSGSRHPSTDSKVSDQQHQHQPADDIASHKHAEPLTLAQKAKKMGIKFNAKEATKQHQEHQKPTKVEYQPAPNDRSPKGSKSSLRPINSQTSVRKSSNESQASNNKEPKTNVMMEKRKESMTSNKSKNSNQSREEKVASSVESSIEEKLDMPNELNNNQQMADQQPRSATHTPSTQHFNDTMFGDEPGERTYSPNELKSLRNNYQHLTGSMEDVNENVNVRQSQDRESDRGHHEEEEIEDEIGEEIDHDEDQSENLNNERFQNYHATTKSEDDVVVDERSSWDPNDTAKLPKHGDENNVIIEISSFTLKENSQVLKRDDIQKLFVGMEFLNIDPADLESKNSMPKPKVNQPVHFNFRKIFPVDADSNIEKRQQLANMLFDNNYSIIRLAVVSEPSNLEQDCEDIGYAFVDVNDIIKSNRNYVDKEIKILDANDEITEIGKMIVTVEILDALNAVQEEINNQLAESVE